MKLSDNHLDGGRYAEVILQEQRFWIAELELGLGVWQGQYQNIDQLWLRWYSATGSWVLTPTEQEHQRTQRLIAQLRSLGVEPDLE